MDQPSQPSLPITGACLCGKVRFEVSKPFAGAHYCHCGGHLYSQSHEDPGQIGVRLGAVDGDPGVRPSSHQYVAYAAPWHPLPDDGLPRHPERMPPHG